MREGVLSAQGPQSKASGCRGVLATDCAPPWSSKVGLGDPPSGGPVVQAQGHPCGPPPKPPWPQGRPRHWDSGCRAQ